jgi:hypothetical protein
VPATAAPKVSNAPLVPLPTLLSPIYTDTYEYNNSRNSAFNVTQSGFPLSSFNASSM